MLSKPKKSFTVLIYFLFLALLSGNCNAKDRGTDMANSIVQATLKAYGGKEAVAKIRTVTALGNITDFINGRRGYYARYLEQPEKLRIEIMPFKGGESRILNGSRGWRSGPGGLLKVGPEMLRSMIYQYSYLDLPMGFVLGSYDITYGGKKRIGKENTELLLINLRNAPTLKVFIDSRSHLISKVSAEFAMGTMGGSELSTVYGDYRPVAGVLFPHRIVDYAGGLKLSQIDLTDIRVNPWYPESFFTPLQP